MALNKGFNLLIGVAVVAAAITIFLVIKVVGAANDRAAKAMAQARSAQAVETEGVLVAKEDIPVGQELQANLVEVKSFPKNLIPENAVRKPEELGGRVAQILITKGDWVLASKIGSKEQLPRPSLQVDNGKRLVTIRVDDTKGNAYLIRNGDFVDLLLTVEIQKFAKDVEGQWQNISATKILLQKVKVFDVEHGVAGGPQQNRGNGLSDKEESTGVQQRQGLGTTATFEVTPEDAEVIISAENKGRISLMLRRFDDDAIAETKGVIETQLIDDIKPFSQVQVEQKPAEPVPPKKKAFY